MTNDSTRPSRSGRPDNQTKEPGSSVVMPETDPSKPSSSQLKPGQPSPTYTVGTVATRDLEPGRDRSLLFISSASFALGAVLGLCAALIPISVGLAGSADAGWLSRAVLALGSAPLWRLLASVSAMCLFHFLEFWAHARANVPNALTKTFLFFNGRRYPVAYASALAECAIRSLLCRGSWLDPARLLPGWTVPVGVGLCLLGQAVRLAAMLEAGPNFNHVVQDVRAPDHVLVRTGVYGYLRHPSYFGFFWWAIGMQLMMGNVLNLGAYWLVLSSFFRQRIVEEELLLTGFFGDEYARYRAGTVVAIPYFGRY